MPIACEKCVPLPTQLGKRFSCPDTTRHLLEDRQDLLLAYYDELNRHAPFAQALADLQALLRPTLPPVQPIPDAAVPLLHQFCTNWILPTDRGLDDLWSSLSHGWAAKASPRLRWGMLAFDLHSRGTI